jgi:hypothetical protein
MKRMRMGIVPLKLGSGNRQRLGYRRRLTMSMPTYVSYRRVLVPKLIVDYDFLIV